jgi:dynein heavy chain
MVADLYIIERLQDEGKKIGFTDDNKNFHNISLGQGQEVVAEQALDIAAKDGHWVILQVILEIISAKSNNNLM